MYISSINTYVIENPKCGSRTIDYVIRRQFCWEDLSVAGHIPYAEAIKAVPSDARIIGVVRHPRDRLVSAVRFVCRTADEIEQRLQIAIDPAPRAVSVISRRVFLPQKTYVDGPRAELFTLDDLQKVLNILGWRKAMPCVNPSLDAVSVKEVTEHPLFAKALSVYEEDFALYNRVFKPVVSW